MTTPPAPPTHIADLHARAADLGIERYRMLRRDELVARIEAAEAARASGKGRSAEAAARPARKRRFSLLGLFRKPAAEAPPAPPAPPAPAPPTAPAPPAAGSREGRSKQGEAAARREGSRDSSASSRSRRSRSSSRGRGGDRPAGRERLAGDSPSSSRNEPGSGRADAPAEPSSGQRERSDRPSRERSGSRRRPRSGSGDRAAAATGSQAAKAEAAADEGPLEEVSGIASLGSHGSGYLRVSGFQLGDDDVQIPTAVARRHDLRPADEVAGRAREARRSDRHRTLAEVDQINGREAAAERSTAFKDLTPVAPDRLIPVETESVLIRAAERLAPLAYGQRVLVRSAPRSGRTTFLRELAAGIAASAEAELILLLIDERPEEIPAWRAALPDAELAIAPADMSPRHQLSVAELALERARRRAEDGADAVLICDSLTRLAAAEQGVALVKRLFGSGRETSEEGSGSLTVIATVLSERASDDEAQRAVETTESSVVRLDPELAAAGVVPAIDAGATSVAAVDRLLDGERLDQLRELRERLAGLEGREAADALRAAVE